jgi:hypothetical protein
MKQKKKINYWKKKFLERFCHFSGLFKERLEMKNKPKQRIFTNYKDAHIYMY